VSDEQKLPPASFEVLLQMLAGPAFVHLGLVPNPATQAMNRDLDQARWHIDLLHVFEERTRGNLNDAERAMLDQMLHELRSVFTKLDE
jgi:uncharacterized protein DUF1844